MKPKKSEKISSKEIYKETMKISTQPNNKDIMLKTALLQKNIK